MSNSRVATSMPRVALAAFVLWSWVPSAAQAVPTASLEYVETALGGGQFRYDYTLFNLADPIADAGYDIFDLFLIFPATAFLSATTPLDWDNIPGPGFLATFSTMPGTPPAGADIGPGQSLSGFQVTFDSAVGNLPFQVFFTNPADLANPVPYSGVSTRAAARVPEPGASLLLGGGIGALLLALQRKRRQAAERGAS